MSFDRNEALERAMDLFWSQGYEGTGMTELLEHMGIQRQSFYNTFQSKSAVFQEAVGLYGHGMLERVTAELDTRGNPVDNIRRVFRMMEQTARESGFCGCLVGNAIAEFGHTDKTMAAFLKEYVGQVEDVFYRAFKRAVDGGYLPPEKDPRALARTFVALSQGLALLSKLELGAAAMKDVMKTAESLLDS